MLGQEYHVIGNGFIIHFIENNGMAFGVEWGGRVGKIFLSLFRILAISALIFELGIATTDWPIMAALRMRVNISAIGSVTLIYTTSG